MATPRKSRVYKEPTPNTHPKEVLCPGTPDLSGRSVGLPVTGSPTAASGSKKEAGRSRTRPAISAFLMPFGVSETDSSNRAGGKNPATSSLTSSKRDRSKDPDIVNLAVTGSMYSRGGSAGASVGQPNAPLTEVSSGAPREHLTEYVCDYCGHPFEDREHPYLDARDNLCETCIERTESIGGTGEAHSTPSRAASAATAVRQHPRLPSDNERDLFRNLNPDPRFNPASRISSAYQLAFRHATLHGYALGMRLLCPFDTGRNPIDYPLIPAEDRLRNDALHALQGLKR